SGGIRLFVRHHFSSSLFCSSLSLFLLLFSNVLLVRSHCAFMVVKRGIIIRESAAVTFRLFQPYILPLFSSSTRCLSIHSSLKCSDNSSTIKWKSIVPILFVQNL